MIERVPATAANNVEGEVSPESVETLKQLREFVAQGYLLHGSKGKIEVLEPHQADDTDKARTAGRQKAVYATHHLEAPLFKALLDRKDPDKGLHTSYNGTNGTWIMEGDENAILTPGYVYVLPPDSFEQLSDYKGEDTLSYTPVTPVAVFRVEPDILKLFDNVTLTLGVSKST